VTGTAAGGLVATAGEAATPGGASAAVVAFEGDLDLASLDDFEAATATAGGGRGLVVDMTEVRFIDSSGIHAVVRARRAQAERGGAIELVVAEGSAVDRVLEMSGLNETLDPKPSLDAALAALDAVTGEGR
jgi:anti-anti-sigma factor